MKSHVVRLVVTMSADDAERFVEDWESDPTAPIMTGGYDSRPVTLLERPVWVKSLQVFQ